MDRHRRQINVPDVIRPVGRDHSAGCTRGWLRLPARRFLEDPPHRARAKMKASPAERLGHFHLTHRGAQDLESLDAVADEIRELVDRLAQLHQGVEPSSSILFIQEAIVAAVT